MCSAVHGQPSLSLCNHLLTPSPDRLQEQAMLVYERGVLQRDIGTYECCVDDLAADASAATATSTTSPAAATAACRVPASR